MQQLYQPLLFGNSIPEPRATPQTQPVMSGMVWLSLLELVTYSNLTASSSLSLPSLVPHDSMTDRMAQPACWEKMHHAVAVSLRTLNAHSFPPRPQGS